MNALSTYRCLTSFVAGVLFLAAAPLAGAGEPHVYRAARIWPGAGAVINNGVLVVEDGRIVAVGGRGAVAIPADAVVHDLGDAVLIPGLVVAESNLAEAGKDDLLALTPDHRAIDGFDPYADYSSALSGGVTTVQISPGGRRLMPGQGTVVKLAGEDLDRRTLREVESLCVVLGSAAHNPPRVYLPPVGAVSVERPLEPTQPQLADSLPGALAGLRATFSASRSLPKSLKSADDDALLKYVAAYGKADRPVRVTAPGTAEVAAALRLGGEFDLNLLLVDPPGLAPFAPDLSAWKERVRGVILNPGVRPGVAADVAVPEPGQKRALSPMENARLLRDSGIPVALHPQRDEDLSEMLFLGGLFTSHNSAADVLRMLTTQPAELLGVSKRVGSLAPGKDADFVVLSGEPFALHTRVREVYVDGERVYRGPGEKRMTVVRAGRIMTGTGEVVNNGALLIEGDKIRGMGTDVSAPTDSAERRFPRAVIVPGFLDLGNGLGLGGAPTGQIGLDTRFGERLVAGEPSVAVARQGGVTTVLLSATTPQPSPVLAFKLGDDPRVVRDPVAIRFAVQGNLTSTGTQLRDTLRSGKAYADSWTRYEAELAEYEKKKAATAGGAKTSAATEKKPEEKKPEEKKEEPSKEEAKKEPAKEEKEEPKKEPAKEEKKEEPKKEEPKPPEKPREVANLEPYRALFAGKIPAFVEAKRADAIRLAVTIFRDEFDLRTVLVGAEDAFRVADLLAEKNVSVAAGPELVRKVDRDLVNLPQSLAVRSIPFGFQSRATTGSQNLPLAVRYAIRQGLGTEDALRGLTFGAARLVGVESTVGSLAVGKDADLVVLSGPPFELSTRVLAVMIDGRWVYQEGEPTDAASPAGR